MDRVSVIIPSRDELHLNNTIAGLLDNAMWDIEIIAVLDGPTSHPLPAYDPRVTYIQLPEPKGMRHAINLGASVAAGKYIMKLDSHCMVAEGFDEVLQKDMQDNWIVIPRFYVLNVEEWKWQDDRFYDYFYLPCPLTDRKQYRFQAGGHWKQRTTERLDILIDENMKLHGSCFFMARDFFLNCLGDLDADYDNCSGEDIEISLKTWLGPWDGRLMVNKNTWYAHMHKGGQRPRGYHMGSGQIRSTYDHIARYWMNNSWKDRKYDLEWLVERFYPVPTWPENWREIWK